MFYTINYVNGSIIYKGLTNTEISFSSQSLTPTWESTVNLKATKALTLVDEKSYILGINTWSIEHDIVNCQTGEQDKRYLKLTGCSKGQFTCTDGECVMMEERCDQVFDCQDESDEIECTLVVLKESYRKTVPPVGLVKKHKDRKLIPASVRVSLTFRDISAIKEKDNEIIIKFMAEFEWTESRATYHNLKKDMAQNTLEHHDVNRLWVPNLIYANNPDDDDTISGLKKSKIKIKREGNCSQSGFDVLEEIEIFRGAENPIIMLQSYTKIFTCKYDFKVFPFDTQVVSIYSCNKTGML